MINEGRDFIRLVSIELLVYDRPSVSEGLCKGGRERKRSSKEKNVQNMATCWRYRYNK